MKLRILRPALEDLAAGRLFYDSQQRGVGAYFFDHLFTEIELLARFGGIHRVVFGYHRLVSHRFPYAIYYRVSGDEATVHRVLPCRRNPAWIRTALKS
jgi:plasmid stabilization system protein ParE